MANFHTYALRLATQIITFNPRKQQLMRFKSNIKLRDDTGNRHYFYDYCIMSNYVTILKSENKYTVQ